jgi:hypothetical protein
MTTLRFGPACCVAVLPERGRRVRISNRVWVRWLVGAATLTVWLCCVSYPGAWTVQLTHMDSAAFVCRRRTA